MATETQNCHKNGTRGPCCLIIRPSFLMDVVISHVFRVVQIGKALQDQQWLFESLMVQVEERRSAVENNAKQIEDR